MKRFLLLIGLVLWACSGSKVQTGKDNLTKQDSIILKMKFDNYYDYWQQVAELEKKGLTKSAYQLVQKIYQKAKKEKNSIQIVKSLLYQSKYMMVVEEEAQLKIIRNFKNEIAENQRPTKNLLESYLAQMYWQYYMENRWKFANRTETKAKIDPADFRTWDLNTIFKEIGTHFERSLQHDVLLKKLPISKFVEIITESKNTEELHPTLYDLLVYEALRFYQTDENALHRPAYKFEIDNPDLLADLHTFLSLKINSKDRNSLQLKALLLYQDWLRFRQQEKNIDALAKADLQRIQFVYKNAVFANKAKVYLKALNHFVQKYEKSKVAVDAWFLIAQQYYNSGNLYQAGKDEKHRWDKKKALEIINNTIKKYPKAKNLYNCYQLKENILDGEVDLQMEENIPENQKALIHFRYKNTNTVVLKIYKIDYEEWQRLENNNYYKKSEAYILKQPLVNQKQIILKNEGDYQLHSIEDYIPELPAGQYILMASTGNNERDDAEYQYFQVANVAVDKMSLTKKPGTIYTVLDRNTGQPLSGLKVDVNIKAYNFHSHNSFTTLQDGTFNYSPKRRYGSETLTVRYGSNKVAYFTDHYYDHYNPSGRKHSASRIFVFTDRAIYRPGQTVFFKAIALHQYENKSEIVTGKSFNVVLKDVNNQKVASVKLQTNDFGSLQGSFVIPSQTLTGRFRIEIQEDGFYTSHGIRVEAYKRPKFEVKFDSLKDNYRVNETVKVTGFAKSFAGTNIGNAQVVYRVKRMVRMPRWFYYWHPVFHTEAQEIAHGTTKTGEQGKFEINFTAIPDKKVKPEDRPVFEYEVYAEVIDINGETHSNSTVVKAGYHNMLAHLLIENQIDKTKGTDTLSVRLTNLNGVKVDGKGIVTAYKLQSPSRVLRSRPWEVPDYQKFSKAEFSKLFPHIPYDKTETDYHYWSKGKQVLQARFDTKQSEKIVWNNLSSLSTGKYLVELKTHDDKGNEIVDKQYVDIISTTDNIVADNKLFDVFAVSREYQPGQTAQIKIGSASKDLYIRIWVEKQGKIFKKELFKTNGTYETVSVPVTKNDIGGFYVYAVMHAYNTVEQKMIAITVPYPSNELQIETIHFRDKLLPGQQETWSFKIKGPKGDKVTAEVLANMYDASLDKFVVHSWSFDPIYHTAHRKSLHFDTDFTYDQNTISLYVDTDFKGIPSPSEIYARLNWFGFRFGNNTHYRYMKKEKAVPVALEGRATGVAIKEESIADNIHIRGESRGNAGNKLIIVDGVVVSDFDLSSQNIEVKVLKDAEAVAIYGAKASNGVVVVTTKKGAKQPPVIKARKNLQETAFFYPQLHTDKNGNISFSFTVPESLTQWKLQLLAHSKKLNYAYKELFTQTQKNLMVFPNLPRFLRQGDRLVLSTKIANLTDKALSGTAYLVLYDAVSQREITNKLLLQNSSQSFSIDAQGNTQVSWTLNIPENEQAIQYKVMAKAGTETDGEQGILPVLSNRMLVTETLPMWVKSNESRSFVLKKLQNNTSKTLTNHRLTLEITSNPAWYAVQALPYLMEYPYECSEQTFSRYYANTLASHIANQNPKIKQVFERWKNTKTLLSNLEKNKELKTIVIEETPWLRDAQSETEQKKRIGLLFDLNRMAYEQKSTLQKLQKMQLSNGGFTWFKGGRYASRYITQHIVAGMGHLQHLQVDTGKSNNMLERAVRYLDNELKNDYQKLLENAGKTKNKQKYLEEYRPSNTQIHLLYARSFFARLKLPEEKQKIYDYYRKQAQKYWLQYNYYTQGLLALVSQRKQEKAVAQSIMKSIEENSVYNEELGRYWKNASAGWYWYQAPIERQSLLIEAFDEITGNIQLIDEMRIWLLKNKQTNAWKTTKQTTEAVYALLLRGTNWLSIENTVAVKIGNQKITPATMPDIKTEAATGYFKKTWKADEIKPQMAKVTLTKKGKGIAWGALYWQYFENLDKITFAKTPVSLTKDLFIRRFTDTGEKLEKITTETTLKTGDLVKVRIEIKVDRAMEFVHLKDMRAGGFEPLNVLSQYKWQDGLGYYESTRDAATNFFISYLPKGVYVFEYDLRANNAGSFSNGITTLQCMYAPEFTSHSKGQHIDIQ